MSTFATSSSTRPRQPPGVWCTSTTASSSTEPRPSSRSFSEGAADVVDRCLMDNMHDEVFVMQAVKSLPPDVQADIRKALGNMAARSRHVGLELIRVCKEIERS